MEREHETDTKGDIRIRCKRDRGDRYKEDTGDRDKGLRDQMQGGEKRWAWQGEVMDTTVQHRRMGGTDGWMGTKGLDARGTEGTDGHRGWTQGEPRV